MLRVPGRALRRGVALAIGFPNFVSVGALSARGVRARRPRVRSSPRRCGQRVYALSAPLDQAFRARVRRGLPLPRGGAGLRAPFPVGNELPQLLGNEIPLREPGRAAPAPARGRPCGGAPRAGGDRGASRRGRYGWAIVAMSTVTVLTLSPGGYREAADSAVIHWMSGEALRVQVADDNLRKIELGSFHSPVGAAIVGLHAALSSPRGDDFAARGRRAR